MEKILSIVIPTYNAEKFLDKGLPTYILDDKEKMKKLEVLVVNDGTPDNSVAVAQKYVEQYPETFKIINKENGGHGSAINVGVEHVTGKYFKCVDADDWVVTDALCHMMDILEQSEAEVVVSSFKNYDLITQSYIPRDIHNPSEDKNKLYTIPEIMEIFGDVYYGMSFHGVTYQTKFYREQNYKLTEHVFYEDQEFATIPMCRATKIQLVEEELYVYRIGDVNQSIAAESQLKKLPDFHKIIFSMIAFEKKLPECPEGARDLWAKKVSMFIASYYQIALIKSKDKKKYRPVVEDINRKIEKESPYIYGCIKNKYKVFRLFNRLHMSNDFYDNQFSKMLKFVKKGFRVDRKIYY